MKHLIPFVIIFSLTACGGDPGGGSTDGGTNTEPNIVSVDDDVVTVDICTNSAGSPPDIFVTGSRNSISIATGCTIRTLEVSGSNNFLTIRADTTIETINTSGADNVISLPAESTITTITNDTGSGNSLFHR